MLYVHVKQHCFFFLFLFFFCFLADTLQKLEFLGENEITCTVKFLSIGTPTLINFQFVPRGKLIIFRCSKICEHHSPVIMCLNIGTLKNC